MLHRVMFTLLAATALVLGGTTMGAAAGGGNGLGGAGGSGGGNGGGDNEYCVFNPGDPGLSESETDSILFMREEEKVARDSYLVLGDMWGMTVFDNIAESEQRHMDAIKNLIDCFGLVDPVIDQVGLYHDPELQHLFDFLMELGKVSSMEALKVGALIEETDIVDIQHSVDITTHDQIISTFESLTCGSRNHLRAFIRNIDNNGGSYTPTVLDWGTFWAIANSPMERDCGD